MNHDINHATRRLLQVVLDMLRDNDAKFYRTSEQCVEAAWRAANEAQQMLLQSAAEPVPPQPMQPLGPWPWHGIPPVTCEPATGAPPANGVTITCENKP